MEQFSIWNDAKKLLPGFEPKLVNIGKNRSILAFDSHPHESNVYDPLKIPVIFLHGFPDNVFGFRLVAPIIVASGRRCLLLSCPGHDLPNISSSWRADGTLNVESVAKDYVKAINEVLGGKVVESKEVAPLYHLIGHDWGAVHASYIATRLHPRQVVSLSLAAVPHGVHAGFKKFPKEQIIDKSWYMAFFQLPYLPEWWLLGRMDGLSLLWRRWSPTYYEADVDTHMESVRRTLSQPGVAQSAINMYRDTLGISFAIQFVLLRLLLWIRWFIGLGKQPFQLPEYPKLPGEVDEASTIFNMPVQGITGANDGCVDTRLFDHHMNEDIERVYPRGYTVHRIPDIGHFSFSEKPTIIANILMETMEKIDSNLSDFQKTQIIKADYFVIGAGATGMAFVDTLLTENKDCTIILVDRYKNPGGHWTLAYPFVRLHQPASSYGVNSKRLGRTDWLDPTDLVSKDEILTYYKEVLDYFILTGRVTYFPECDADIEASTFKSLTNVNLCYKVLAKTIVNSTYTNVMVPSMRPPPFEIKGSNNIVGKVNDVFELVKSQREADFVVVGAGKTGVDTILELLRLDVPSSQIVWVISNDAWYVIREMFEPKVFYDRLVFMYTQFGESTCTEDIFLKLEAGPHPIAARLDQDIIPKIFKGATISLFDIPKLRSIRRKVRLGRIIRVENETIFLERGTLPFPKGSCMIDCTANGLPPTKPIPVFSGNRITLQTLMKLQPVFSAAIIAYIAVNVSDQKSQNDICTTESHPVTINDFLLYEYNSTKVYKSLQQNGHLRFLEKSRLNVINGASRWRLLWALLGPSRLGSKIDKFLHKMENDYFEISYK